MVRKLLKHLFIFSVFFTAFLQNALAFSEDTSQVQLVTPQHTYTVNSAINLGSLEDQSSENTDLIEAKRQFDELSAEQKELFEQSRQFYLTKVAQVLENKNLVFGSLVRSSHFLKKIKAALASEPTLPEGEIGIMVRRLMDEERERLEKVATENEKKSTMTLGREAIQKMLTALNNTMLKQARLISTSNEFGITVNFGVGAHLGSGDKAIGGAVKLAFNFGFDRQRKVATFELGMILERTIRAITPVILATVDLNGGLYMRDSKVRGLQKGRAYVTPALPTTATIYPSQFEAVVGFGVGLPPFLSEMMGYITKTYRFPVIRIEAGLEPRFNFKVSFASRSSIRCEALLAR